MQKDTADAGTEGILKAMQTFGQKRPRWMPGNWQRPTYHELAPDWDVIDKTPYGHECAVRVNCESGEPRLSVCKEDYFRSGRGRWFHPPKNTSLLWPSHDVTLPREFNPADGITLQHMAPVQSNTTVVKPATQGKYNSTWQMLMLHGSNSGVSTGTVTIPYSKCIGRGLGTMGVDAIEMYENVILQTRPDLAAWHASVIPDRERRLEGVTTTTVANFTPPIPIDRHKKQLGADHYPRCSDQHCFCKDPHRDVCNIPLAPPRVQIPSGVELVVTPALLAWLDAQAPVPPQPSNTQETLVYTDEQPEVTLCTGYEKAAVLANHVFFNCSTNGMFGARRHGRTTSIAFNAFVNRCKDLNVSTEYALGAMFPHHYTLLHEDGTPVGCMPSSLWAADNLSKAGFAPLEQQIRAMLCRLGSSTAYDPVLHSTLFSLLLANVNSSRSAKHVLKYGLESAFPTGVSKDSYKSWYGHDMFDHTKISNSSSTERFLFLQAMVKRFQNLVWFLTITLNMKKTTGFEEFSKKLSEDKQRISCHCTMFVRKWHRAALALVEWLVHGVEQPLGPLGHRFVRAEFQPCRGGIQHYHCLLETLLNAASLDPEQREEVLRNLRACVTRNLPHALHALGLPQDLVTELCTFAETILRHYHDADCMTKVDPITGLTFCKRGCPWAASADEQGHAKHIRLCADPNVKQVLLDLGIAYQNSDDSISLQGIPDAHIHVYHSGGLQSTELSSVNAAIFLIVLSNTNLQLVDRNFVIDYLEWYAVADNERSLMYMKANPDGTWNLHAASEDWHKKGAKPDDMHGYAICIAEMIFLMLGYAYVTSDVERVQCTAVQMSRRFMHYNTHAKHAVSHYGVIDECNNVTRPVDMSLLGQTLQMNPAQTGKGRSKAMVWMSMNDLADTRDLLKHKFTDEQIDLMLSFQQVTLLVPDPVSQWAGRDPELFSMLLETYHAHTMVSGTAGEPNLSVLGERARDRGYFLDVFGTHRLLRASLFREASVHDLAVQLVCSICDLDKENAELLCIYVRNALPERPMNNFRFDYNTLPAPFNVLVGTLTDCVVMLRHVNPCDGNIFLYQWALRHSVGPTEADIFRTLRKGGNLLDVLHENDLIDKDTNGSYDWKNLVADHFYTDMQYQPLHRKDREGILQKSVEALASMFENKESVIRCIAVEDLDEFRVKHGEVHIVLHSATGNLQLACLQSQHRVPTSVLLACTKLTPQQAGVVADQLSNGINAVFLAMTKVKDHSHILLHKSEQLLPYGTVSTSLAVISIEHQLAFEAHARSRYQSLMQVFATLPAWEQTSSPPWAKDPQCKCSTQPSKKFPSDEAWDDMQQAMSIITTALHKVRDAAAMKNQIKGLILVGPPGTGKTHLLKETLRRAMLRCISTHCQQCTTAQCCGACRLNCECTATASLRAAALSSLNLHKLFGFGSWGAVRTHGNQQNPTALYQRALDYLARHPEVGQYLRHVEVLLIDELAFVPSAILEAVSLLLIHLKKNSFFCGNVLVVGTADHHQNCPIGDNCILEDMYAMQFFIPLQLKHLVRCQCDVLQTACREMRSAEICDESVDRIIDAFKSATFTSLQNVPPQVPVIVGRRKNMQALVKERLAQHPTSLYTIKARDYKSTSGRACIPTSSRTHMRF